MNKIKKLGIAVVALAMCVLLGVTVWAAPSEVNFAATASDTDFCITGEEQTVTVLISASEEIGLFSLDADLIVPDGWSATVSSVDLSEDGFLYNGKNVIWIDSEAAGDVSAKDLFKIDVTIPASVTAGTYTIGVENLELTDVTINGKTYSELYWTEDATLSVEIVVKAHAYPTTPVYKNDGETHTETLICANDATHVITKTGVSHDFTNGDCVCGAKAPVTDITVIAKGNISHTVEGQVVTVTHTLACKVGYLQGGKYVAIAATHVEGNTYTFTAPEGVTEVLLVVKGDVTGEGSILTNDVSRLNAYVLGKTTLTAEAQFAADVTGEGSILTNDVSRLNASVLGKTTLAW